MKRNGDSPAPARPVGWAIGSNPEGTAVILHTKDGGLNWSAQGDTSLWKGLGGNDISAVDHRTAWAALGAGNGASGRIVHTENGATWEVQPLPAEMRGGVKGIKGVCRKEAWAVGLRGPVMRTQDGGKTWSVVDTGTIAMEQVNRMDVLGDDIWIADSKGGAEGVIHSWDSGQAWRREKLPKVRTGLSPMTMSIVSPLVAWTNVNDDGNLYRTVDGGVSWNIDAPDVSGGNDIDDVCAVSRNDVWAVQNISGASAGHVMRIRLTGSKVDVRDWSFPNYVYEGVSAFDELTAWVVGFRSVGAPSSMPAGSILHTSDGETWKSQLLPIDNAGLWKVSFVGARR